jgi:hypothetical protein
MGPLWAKRPIILLCSRHRTPLTQFKILDQTEAFGRTSSTSLTEKNNQHHHTVPHVMVLGAMMLTVHAHQIPILLA